MIKSENCCRRSRGNSAATRVASAQHRRVMMVAAVFSFWFVWACLLNSAGATTFWEPAYTPQGHEGPVRIEMLVLDASGTMRSHGETTKSAASFALASVDSGVYCIIATFGRKGDVVADRFIRDISDRRVLERAIDSIQLNQSKTDIGVMENVLRTVVGACESRFAPDGFQCRVRVISDGIADPIDPADNRDFGRLIGQTTTVATLRDGLNLYQFFVLGGDAAIYLSQETSKTPRTEAADSGLAESVITRDPALRSPDPEATDRAVDLLINAALRGARSRDGLKTPAPMRVATLIDKTWSSRSSWVQQPGLTDLATVFELVGRSGGEIAVGVLTKQSTSDLVRAKIDVPPTPPILMESQNPFRKLKFRRKYEEELQNYDTEFAGWSNKLRAAIRSFADRTAPLMGMPPVSEGTDIWSGVRRADLFLAESDASWRGETTRRYLVVMTDGLHNATAEQQNSLRSEAHVCLVNGSGNSHALTRLNPELFGSFEAALSWIKSQEATNGGT